MWSFVSEAATRSSGIPTDHAKLPTTAPDHRELKSGTLPAILPGAGLTPPEFRELF